MKGIMISFDVESVGLHGEGYAVGWVVYRDGVEVSEGYLACASKNARGRGSDRKWIEAHVDPHLPKPNCPHPKEVRERFFQFYRRGADYSDSARERLVLIADCAWPVEARFLAACIDDKPIKRNWQGPYPLHDVATLRLAAGLDPLLTEERLPNEMPAHHPTADARQSGRSALEALATIREITV